MILSWGSVTSGLAENTQQRCQQQAIQRQQQQQQLLSCDAKQRIQTGLSGFAALEYS